MTTVTHPTDRPAISTSRKISAWIDRHLRGLFILPSIIYIAVMIVFPIGYTVFLSFTNSQGAVSRPFRFIGFDNYTHWLTERYCQDLWIGVSCDLLITS